MAENYLKNSGIDYTIVRPGGLKAKPPTGALVISGEDTLNSGEISRDLVADVTVASLTDSKATNKVLGECSQLPACLRACLLDRRCCRSCVVFAVSRVDNFVGATVRMISHGMLLLFVFVSISLLLHHRTRGIGSPLVGKSRNEPTTPKEIIEDDGTPPKVFNGLNM